MRRYGLAAFVFVLVLLPTWGQTVVAQDTSLSEIQFWERMIQTEELLSGTDSQVDPSAAISQVRSLWEGIDQIRLADETRVTVDLGWIRAALTDGQPNSLVALHRQIKALIAYHDNQTYQLNESGGDSPMTTLMDVLRDPRFQYDDITPTPVLDIPQVRVPQSSVISSAAQLILLIAGITALIVVFVYFARSLQVQQAVIETDPNSDPTTANDAHTLATDHAESQDYRSAIRYLYLASLLMLDERGKIHYDSSLTNREHLSHLNNQPQLHDLLRWVINAFEEVWYGYRPIDESYYQRFRQRVDELNRMVT